VFGHEELSQVANDLLVVSFYALRLVAVNQRYTMVDSEPLVDLGDSLRHQLRTRVGHESAKSTIEDAAGKYSHRSVFRVMGRHGECIDQLGEVVS
jgi:hypothetical protein